MDMAEKIRVSLGGASAEPLNVKLNSVVSSGKVTMPLPTIVQNTGLENKYAMTFLKDVAEGKRKIANAVKNKYEGTSGTASEITEYSTFEELSNKISQIPIEVPLGSAMEQNGGVLPFYDVYNETLKAMKEFAGYGFNGCCAFELDKWDYDDNNKVTLSEASAYYTSDGTFIKDNIIYKNGSQIGELDNSLYQFQDVNAENTNRFVVYFFVNERYQVPKSLPTTSCLGLWCIKGTPLMSFSGDFTQLNSINVYDGELVVSNDNDCKLGGLTNVRKFHLPHIKEINGGTGLFYAAPSSLKVLSLPNLKRIDTGLAQSFLRDNSSLKEMYFPELEYVGIKANVYLFNRAEGFQKLSFPKLKEIRNSSAPQSAFIYYSHNISLLEFPTLEKTNKILMSTALKQGCKLVLGKPKGGDITIGGNSYLENITVEKGFASKLNLTGCNGLSREVLVDIINNLADLTDTEYADKLTLTLGTTLYDRITADDRLIATNKKWQVVK